MTADLKKVTTATRPRYGCLNDSELVSMTASFTSPAFALPFRYDESRGKQKENAKWCLCQATNKLRSI